MLIIINVTLLQFTISTFTVIFAVGVFDDVNVNVPAPCAEQYTPAVVYTSKDDGSGDMITLFDAVTPVQLTVPNAVVTVIC